MQSRFSSENSRERALIVIVAEWKEGLSSNKLFLDIFFDIQKEFEAINIETLIMKYEEMDFSEKWIEEKCLHVC